MLQVRRHFHKGNPEIVRLCRLSKELYNRCNFLMRRSWFANVEAKRRDPEAEWKPQPGLPELVQETKGLECFGRLHNTKTAKQTIRKCVSDWSNFRASLRAYKKNPSLFLRKPKPPHYKDSMAQVIFYNETIRNGQTGKGLDRLEPTNGCFSLPWDGSPYKQVVITPKKFGFVVDVQYDSSDRKEKIKNRSLLRGTSNSRKRMSKKRICSIDIGLNNLAAITLGQQHPNRFELLSNPILVNGRVPKSFNQWYNKQLAKQMSNGASGPSKRILRKRYFRIENYFHHVSKFIVDLCLEHGIPRIVIGRNKGWKNGMNLGKRVNQKFHSMPFHLLIEKIRYKAALEGIEVVLTEEAYTSKSSFLDGDPLPRWEKDMETPKFSGRRKHRGLYVSSEKYALNADVNGSLNIGRKVIGESPSMGIADRSLAARPVIVNPLKVGKDFVGRKRADG